MLTDTYRSFGRITSVHLFLDTSNVFTDIV